MGHAARALLLALLACTAHGLHRAAPPLSRPHGARPRLRAGAAPAPASSRAALLQLRGGAAASSSAAMDVVAQLMGWAVCLGSCGLYAPMLVRVLRTRSAEGLSPTTWAMQLLGYVGCSIYPIRMGYDFSTYFERLSLSLQACVLFGAVLRFQLEVDRAIVFGIFGTLAAGWALSVRSLPKRAAETVQLVASVGLSVSIVPQLALNARERSAKGWSLTTALLSTAGNAVRCFTTLQARQRPSPAPLRARRPRRALAAHPRLPSLRETLCAPRPTRSLAPHSSALPPQLADGDRLLLAGFVSGLALNAMLLGQMAYYGDYLA